MTDKEFKRLKRSQLIDIIYELQVKQEELIAENEKLSEELADKRIRLNKSGNIAVAALDIHGVMQSAQDAAAHYVQEIQIRANEREQQIIKDAETKAAAIIEQAKKDAAEIIEQAQKI